MSGLDRKVTVTMTLGAAIAARRGARQEARQRFKSFLKSTFVPGPGQVNADEARAAYAREAEAALQRAIEEADSHGSQVD